MPRNQADYHTPDDSALQEIQYLGQRKCGGRRVSSARLRGSMTGSGKHVLFATTCRQTSMQWVPGAGGKVAGAFTSTYCRDA
jgi:hypothetical protein